MPTAMECQYLASGPTVQYALTKQAVLKSLNREPWDSAALESWGKTRFAKRQTLKKGLMRFAKSVRRNLPV